MQDPKICHLRTIAQLCRGISSHLRHVSTIGKNSSVSHTWPHNMVNFGPLAAEICWRVWGTPVNFNGFRVLQRYCMASSNGRQPNFAALNRGRHLYSAGRPLRWALAHICSYILKLCSRVFVLHCRSRPKYDRSRHFDPHFEEVRGGIEPWWIARWKARAEFLLYA